MNYNSVQHETWKQFYQAAMSSWKRNEKIIHDAHMANVHVLEKFSDRIPTIDELNDLVSSVGWKVSYVDGYTAPWIIAELLSKKTLPVSSSIRPLDKLHFADEPDLIHDVFGHFPILFDDGVRAKIETWAKLAVSTPCDTLDKAAYYINKAAVDKARFTTNEYGVLEQTAKDIHSLTLPKPSKFSLLDRFYFWFFEFGILKIQGETKIFGAGLLSSLSELEKIQNEVIDVTSICFKKLNSDYEIADKQKVYLVGENFSDYERVFEEISELREGACQH